MATHLVRVVKATITSSQGTDLTVGQAEFLNKVIDEAAERFKNYVETECTHASVEVQS